MNTRFFALTSLLLVTGLNAACSRQWRTAKPDITGQEIITELENIQGSSRTNAEGEGAKDFYELLQTDDSTVYYANSDGEFGPVASILSVASYEFISPQLAGYGYEDIQYAVIAFIDRPTDQGDECALMIYLQTADTENNEFSQFYKCMEVSVEGGEFVAKLQSDDGATTIALRSYDVDKEGFLNGVIQMRVSEFDASGNEYDNGQFSTLVGFGP